MVGLRTAVKSFTYVGSLIAPCSSVRYERASSPGILQGQTVGPVAGGVQGIGLNLQLPQWGFPPNR